MNEHENIDFYQSHLDKVSRSFAFCIRELKGEFRFYVSLSYLLFRVLDTIEDSSWSSLQEQSDSFDTFFDFINKAPSKDQIEKWALQIDTDIPVSERNLLNDSEILFNDFHSLNIGVKKIIGISLKNMLRGMKYYSNKNGQKGIKLKNLIEVNRYCFFVAGIVGELLNSLFQYQISKKGVTPENSNQLSNALHFGLFLQKVNLLKDQLTDEQVGRYLVHNRNEVQVSLLTHAKKSLSYILNIPKDQSSYRLFCAWSLFLGLASMPWIEKSWNKRKLIKIPRLKTKLLLGKVQDIIKSNESLSSLFESLIKQIAVNSNSDSALEAESDSFEFPELEKLYQGNLTNTHFKEIGLV